MEAFISDIVLREISETKDNALRDKLIEQIKGLSILDISEECERLASDYILQGDAISLISPLSQNLPRKP